MNACINSSQVKKLCSKRSVCVCVCVQEPTRPALLPAEWNQDRNTRAEAYRAHACCRSHVCVISAPPLRRMAVSPCPWSSVEEWDNVFDLLFSSDTDSQRKGISINKLAMS